ncbi:enoyl-CoA hydratase [Amylibacter marinus]|uniref:Enoyl-CoA hydratase n=1 Tax=Amylibacter marinus TaxID=1475483 RepID=A0ABQ5VRB1_9RHOB|nr:crotonase/enoyl-CoA hydratase family protein [Amylibacter marinus]GLQ33806.1 enoyl-CoA hydratase [Amylibacter marinus]
MTQTLTTEITDDIARVTLNRPQQKNAMSFDMMRELYDVGQHLSSNTELRAIILIGAGDTFCAGIDLGDLMGAVGDMDAIHKRLSTQITPEIGNFFQAPTTIWGQLDVPVIAAIQGYALGAGAQLALGADFRFIAPDARFGLLEAKWGLIPDMGVTQSLPRLIREDQAMDLMMTGRTLDADETLQMGLATRIANDPYAEALEFAQLLSQRSPDTLRDAKKLARTAWATPNALQLEATLQSKIIATPNQMEMVAASMGKRAPKFR